MDRDQLRALQAPLKESYKTDPDAAGDHAVRERDARRGHLVLGRQPAVRSPKPGCTRPPAATARCCARATCCWRHSSPARGVTLRAVATSLGVDVAGGRVLADGDLDFRGTLAVDREAPVGFRDIRLRFELDTDADDEQLASLLKLTERLLRRLPDAGERPGARRHARARHGDRLTAEGPPVAGPRS